MNRTQILARFHKALEGIELNEDDNSEADGALFNEFHEFEPVPTSCTSLSFGSLGDASTFSDYLSRCVGLKGARLKEAVQESINEYLADLA